MSDGRTVDATAPVERDGRVVAIDILRGLAILWVITFHLWADMTLTLRSSAGPVYTALGDRLREGNVLAIVTAAGEVVLATGYHGVALFMVLSGVSLTLNAYRRGEPSVLAGYYERARKLLLAYWGSIAIKIGVVAIVAALQLWLNGGTYSEQWGNVTLALLAPISLTVEDLLWGISVVGWLFRDAGYPMSVGSMWFIPLLLQYYLLFPFLLRALKRVGVTRFIIAGVVVTIVARALMILIESALGDPGHQARLMPALAPLRLTEFTFGMALGYLLVHKRTEVGEWVHSPLDVAGIVVIGVLLQMAGAVLGPRAELLAVLQDPAVHLGMVCYALPLLFKIPGRLEVSMLARVLVFTGIISLPVLMVNDGLRIFATFLRYEGLPGPYWWFFLVVIYVPVGVLISHPIARFFGLLPNQRRRSERHTSPDIEAQLAVPTMSGVS